MPFSKENHSEYVGKLMSAKNKHQKKLENPQTHTKQSTLHDIEALIRFYTFVL